MAHQNIRVQFDELFRESLNSIGVGISPAIVDANILTICPTEFLEPLLKYRYALADVSIAFRDRHQYANAPHAIGLLRTCC